MSLGWFLSWPRMAASQAIVIETHLGPPSRWQIVTFDCSLPLPGSLAPNEGSLPSPPSVTSRSVTPRGVSQSLA